VSFEPQKKHWGHIEEDFERNRDPESRTYKSEPSVGIRDLRILRDRDRDPTALGSTIDTRCELEISCLFTTYGRLGTVLYTP
jgi:hypothetical protein